MHSFATYAQQHSTTIQPQKCNIMMMHNQLTTLHAHLPSFHANIAHLIILQQILASLQRWVCVILAAQPTKGEFCILLYVLVHTLLQGYSAEKLQTP